MILGHHIWFVAVANPPEQCLFSSRVCPHISQGLWDSFFVLYAQKGEGIASIYSALYYQQINKHVPSLSSRSPSLSISPSPIHICLAAYPSNAVPPLYLPHFSHLPYPISLFPPSPAAQVMSFFFSWIPLPSPASPSSRSLLRFPLASGSSLCSIHPR